MTPSHPLPPKRDEQPASTDDEFGEFQILTHLASDAKEMLSSARKQNEKLRSIIGNIAKWLEEYNELSIDLLKFEHPADREAFYKKAESLIDDYATARAIEVKQSERAWAYKNMRDHGADPDWVDIAKSRYEKAQKQSASHPAPNAKDGGAE